MPCHIRRSRDCGRLGQSRQRRHVSASTGRQTAAGYVTPATVGLGSHWTDARVAEELRRADARFRGRKHARYAAGEAAMDLQTCGARASTADRRRKSDRACLNRRGDLCANTGCQSRPHGSASQQKCKKPARETAKLPHVVACRHESKASRRCPRPQQGAAIARIFLGHSDAGDSGRLAKRARAGTRIWYGRSNLERPWGASLNRRRWPAGSSALPAEPPA